MHSAIAPSLRDAAQQPQFHFPAKPPCSQVRLPFRVSKCDKLVKKDTSKASDRCRGTAAAHFQRLSASPLRHGGCQNVPPVNVLN